jgi:hypothetical protein
MVRKVSSFSSFILLTNFYKTSFGALKESAVSRQGIDIFISFLCYFGKNLAFSFLQLNFLYHLTLLRWAWIMEKEGVDIAR